MNQSHREQNQIERLPADVAAQIVATSKITSLDDVVIGLVQNSLDAGAHKITVDVDFYLGNCVVEDDGIGLDPATFDESSGLGQADYTSKSGSETTFGSAGCFLHHLAVVSLLTVASRHLDYRSCNSAVFHHGRLIGRFVPAPDHHHLRSSGHGVRVAVRDLFGNLPLRVKHRAYSIRGPADLDRLFVRLRYRLLRLLVAYNRPVLVRLHDLRRSKVAVLGERLGPGDTRPSTAPARFDPKAVLSFLSQASLIDSLAPSKWIPASLSSRLFTVKGAICITPGPSRMAQFISVGIWPLSPDEVEYKDVYNHVNSVFSASNFFLSDGPTDDPPDALANLKIRGLQSSQTADKWPMFVLKATPLSPSSGSEFRSDVDLQRLKDALGVLVTQWLEVNLFRPVKAQKRRYCQTPSGNWAQRSSRATSAASTSGTTTPSENNPARTQSQPSQVPDPQQVEKCRLIVQRSRKSLGRAATDPEPKPDSWIGEFLDQWQNPVFKPAPASNLIGPDGRFNGARIISQYFSSTPSSAGAVWLQPQTVSRLALRNSRVIGQLDRKFILVMVEGHEEVEYTNGRVSHTLVAIDQHAADERIKVEQLFAQLCSSAGSDWSETVPAPGVDFSRLSPPLEVSLSALEATRIDSGRDFFASWGVTFQLDREPDRLTSQNEDTTVSILTLPRVVSERCRREPRLAATILRSEVWRREDGGVPCCVPSSGQEHGHPVGSSPDNSPGWLDRLGQCPPAIVDLVNSRACRSAIMFNDVLSIDDCAALVDQLGLCAFPFQCAHGRPSMVPVLRLDNDKPGQTTLWDFDCHELDAGIAEAWGRKGDATAGTDTGSTF